MSLFGKKKVEFKESDYPRPRPEAPPRPDVEKRLNNLKERQEEMVGVVCSELAEKTKNLDIDWKCKSRTSGYEYRAYVGWGSLIEIEESGSHISIRLLPNRNYVNQCFLDVDFYESSFSSSAAHRAANLLLKAIKQQPDILEKHFETFMHEIRRDWPEDADLDTLSAANDDEEKEDETKQDEH